jgi:glycerophosphoryl diester phosphodiesterase
MKAFLCPLGVRRFAMTGLVLIALAACETFGKGELQAVPERQSNKLYVIGHRGAAGLAPENTLAAFVRAMEIGVDGVELDVLMSADGEVVVHHDFRLKPQITRTADGAWLEQQANRAVKNLTLPELRAHDVGRLRPGTGYARRYPEQQPADGEPIPTLREVISLLKKMRDKSTELWIEIKTSPEEPDMTPSPASLTDAVIRVLREENASARARILAFDWRCLVHVQRVAPEIPTIYLSHVGVRLNNIKPGQPGSSPWMAGLDVDDFSGSVPRAVKAAGGRHWAPHYKYITYRLIEEAHGLGIQVYVWTPDSRPEMLRLMEMGVDGIITNRPDILRSLVIK